MGALVVFVIILLFFCAGSLRGNLVTQKATAKAPREVRPLQATMASTKIVSSRGKESLCISETVLEASYAVPQWMKCKTPAQFKALPHYGQSEEDILLWEEYFRSVVGGTFLEMGALDGETYSNSKMFEDSFGWTGKNVRLMRV